MDIFKSQSLTLEDWQNICRQNLAIQKQFTTNLFTNFYGVTPEPSEIYIPVAIKAEQSLTCITEKCFFEEVFQQGKSQLTQGRRIALIGKRGSGKTTRLQKIADFILEQKLGLPIWISLANLTQPTITQYIEQIWLKQTSQSLTIDELTQQKKQIWLLLDGWDEMISRLERHQVSALLGEWMQATRVVITCWDNVWEADKNAFLGFDIFHHFEFNSQQVTDYIRCWFATMGDATAGESLEAALAKSENCRIKVLIENPLRLWMLCQIWQTEGSLPQTPAGLYGQFMNCVYSWKEDEEIFNQREAIDKALARLALAGMEQKEEVSRFGLPESWVVEVLGSRRLFQVVMKLGLLNRVERFQEAICTFFHATFQEYFAALAVDDWDYFLPRNHVNLPVEGKEYRIFESRWKQVILFWFGREDIAANEKEGFLEKLINFDDGCGSWNYAKVDKGFYEYRANFLAGAIISEFKHSCFADTIVSQIFKSCVMNNLDSVHLAGNAALIETDRQRVLNCLLQMSENYYCLYFDNVANIVTSDIAVGNEAVIQHFILLLERNTPKYIRNRITNVLSKIAMGNESAIYHLIQLLTKALHEDTRISVTNILSEIAVGNQEAINRLILVFNQLLHKETRRSVANILDKIAVGNEPAIDNLIQLLDENSNEEIRQSVARSLGNIAIGNESAIYRLIQLLDETSNEESRGSIAYSLGKIAVENEFAIHRLIKFLDETPNYFTRLNVAISLSKNAVGNKSAIHCLIQLLFNDKISVRLFYWILDSLGRIAAGNEEVVDHLIFLLDETSDKYIHNCIVLILGKIAVRHELAIHRLMLLLINETSKTIRRNILNSFENIAVENESAINRLIQLLDEVSDEDTCNYLAIALCVITVKNERAINRLIQFLDETSDESTQSEIFYSLGNISVKNEAAINRLIQLLDETFDQHLCRIVANSLGKIAVGNKGAIKRLVQFLDEPSDESTQSEVANSLGKIAVGNEEAIHRLIQLFNETSDKNTRNYVANSLGKIAVGKEGAILHLIQLLDETSDEYIRNTVADILGRIARGNEMAIDRLIQLLDEHFYECTRWTILNSLCNIALGNEGAIARLIQLLYETSNKPTREKVIDSLDKIIATKKQSFTIISSLKHQLNNEIYENKFNLYEECYRLIWKYAQNLPYPDFYRAWHGLNEA